MKKSNENKKEFKAQNFTMWGVGENMGFMKEGKHAWFIIKDSITNTKYMFKYFNIPEDKKKALEDGENFKVKFNIGYNKNKAGNLELTLIATDIEAV